MNELNEMSQVPPTLYVVDASAFIFRNFYGMRERLADAGLVYVEDLEELGEFNGIDCRGR